MLISYSSLSWPTWPQVVAAGKMPGMWEHLNCWVAPLQGSWGCVWNMPQPPWPLENKAKIERKFQYPLIMNVLRGHQCSKQKWNVIALTGHNVLSFKNTFFTFLNILVCDYRSCTDRPVWVGYATIYTEVEIYFNWVYLHFHHLGHLLMCCNWMCFVTFHQVMISSPPAVILLCLNLFYMNPLCRNHSHFWIQNTAAVT